MKKVSACIVTYDGYGEARLAANTLIEQTKGVELSLFIVDNNSPDGTGEKMREEFAEKATVILLPKNKGFSGGHNEVISRIESDYHAVVNPDITLTQDALLKIVQYMEANPEVIAVVPKLLFPSGEEQLIAKREPTLLALISRRIPLPGLKKLEEHYLMLDEDLTIPQKIEFCTGCFFVMRTEMFKKIGGFDERYFMYFEDADIGRMALEYGDIVYLPTAQAYHAWHRQTKNRASHFFMQLRSMFRYFGKWGFRLK